MMYCNLLLVLACLGIVNSMVTPGTPGQKSVRVGKPSTIAFSVGLTTTLHAQYSDIVVYNKVFSNFGDGYSPFTGEFTAPAPGVYAFHVHAYNSNKDKAMWIELVKNVDALVSVSGYNSHSTAGNSVIVNLNKGDTVFVRARPGQEFTLFGRNDQIYTTFTGYRVGDIPYADPSTVVG